MDRFKQSQTKSFASAPAVLGARSRNWLFAAPLMAALLLASSAVMAHHSVSQFDSRKEVSVTGTVKRLEWANPHVWIRIDVPDESGDTVEWGVEASNPLDLGRKGWSKKSFQPGDEVTIVLHPARNGKPFGAFISATLADGEKLKG